VSPMYPATHRDGTGPQGAYRMHACAGTLARNVSGRRDAEGVGASPRAVDRLAIPSCGGTRPV